MEAAGVSGWKRQVVRVAVTAEGRWQQREPSTAMENERIPVKS